MVTEVIEVKYQQHNVAALSFNTDTGIGAFEYEPDFIDTGIELAPLTMPLAASSNNSSRIYSFPALDYDSFKGLPGLIADSLPDDFGNAVLNAWAAQQGKLANDITPLQRLQYIGKRGMGALSYVPATRLKNLNAAQAIEINSLVAIAQEVLDNRERFKVSLGSRGEEDREAMMALLSVGTSAGGARAKAVLAFDAAFTKVRSGQTDVPEGFTHYLVKFDGVVESRRDQETFGDPQGYGVMEYVYYQMAKRCGINMMPSRLLNEGSRRHFMTQRFDRVGNAKRHIQTLNGMAHISYRQPGIYSYAELFGVARQLKLPATAAEQLFRRMVFNVVARNHDDHSKNFAFILNKSHRWQLAPAYDLAFSYKPGSHWVNSHWMTINGKRDNFNREDFYSFSKISPLFSRRFINAVIDETIEHVSQWEALAREQDVPARLRNNIAKHLRLAI